MILGIYPLVTLGIFMLSLTQLVGLLVYRARRTRFTALQKWLQVFTIFCLVMHICAAYSALRAAYTLRHIVREGTYMSKLHTFLAYVNHSLLRIISILCLSVALRAIGGTLSPGNRAVQMAIHIYSDVRWIPLFLFNIEMSGEPSFKNVVVETLLASESVLLCGSYLFLLVRATATLKSEEAMSLTDYALSRLIFCSYVFSLAFLLEFVFRAGVVVVSISPRSWMLGMVLSACNGLRVLHQMLIIEGIGGVAFLDVHGDSPARRLGIDSMRRHRFRFFRFRSESMESDHKESGDL